MSFASLPALAVYAAAIAGVFLLVWWGSDRLLGVPRATQAPEGESATLPPAGKRAAWVTGALAALLTSLGITAPVIALERGGGAGLLVGSFATFLVGAVALLATRVLGAPTPRKPRVVLLVTVTALAFAADAVLHVDAVLVSAYALAGLLMPLLATLGDRTAKHFEQVGAYHGLRNQVAAWLSAAFTCIPLLSLVGAARWITAILAALFVAEAVALLLWRMPEQGGVRRTAAAVLRSRRPRPAGRRGTWREPVFHVSLALFVVGQLLGTAAGVMYATRLHGSTAGQLVTLAFVLSRLLAGRSFRRAGQLADRGLDVRGARRCGSMFVAAGFAFAATVLAGGDPWVIAIGALTSFALLTLGLNALLVIARARITHGVEAPTAVVDLNWTGALAGFVGGAVPPLVLPPGASGPGVLVLACGVVGLGVTTVWLAARLARIPSPAPDRGIRSMPKPKERDLPLPVSFFVFVTGTYAYVAWFVSAPLTGHLALGALALWAGVRALNILSRRRGWNRTTVIRLSLVLLAVLTIVLVVAR